VRVHHVNLQTLVGGGELYTRAMTQALLDAGCEVTLCVHPENRFWDSFGGKLELVAARDERELPDTQDGTWIVHTKLSEDKARRVAARNVLVGFAHLPMVQRKPEWLNHCTLVATVSQYCIDLLRGAGVERLHAEPLYGYADVARGDPAA